MDSLIKLVCMSRDGNSETGDLMNRRYESSSDEYLRETNRELFNVMHLRIHSTRLLLSSNRLVGSLNLGLGPYQFHSDSESSIESNIVLDICNALGSPHGHLPQLWRSVTISSEAS